MALNYEPRIGHIEGGFEIIEQIVQYAETSIFFYTKSDPTKSIVLERLGIFYQTYCNLVIAFSFFQDHKESYNWIIERIKNLE